MRRILAFVLALCLAACSVALPAPTQPTSAAPAIGSSPTPLAWAGLGLSGRLILIVKAMNGFAIISVDLQTGNNHLIYQSDQGALLSSALVSPESMRTTYMTELRQFLTAMEKGCADVKADYKLFNTKTPLEVALSEYLYRRSQLG